MLEPEGKIKNLLADRRELNRGNWWSRSGEVRRIPPISHLSFERNTLKLCFDQQKVKGIGKMKGSGPLVAFVLAASAVALTSSSSAGHNDVNLSLISSNQGYNSTAKNCASRNCTASESEKFAPRFDGLRFIETLVTAHR